jgi:hypothetical protein
MYCRVHMGPVEADVYIRLLHLYSSIMASKQKVRRSLYCQNEGVDEKNCKKTIGF